MKDIKEKLQKLSAEIGMIELQRNVGRYISGNLLLKKKNEFRKLSYQYKKLYLKGGEK